MEFDPKQEGECAGLVVVQSNEYHYRLTRVLKDGSQRIVLIKCEGGKDEVVAEQECDLNKIYLRVVARGQDYSFYYGETPSSLQLLLGNCDGRILSTDVAGGFVGTYIGLYASSNGETSENFADFDWFEYTSL